MKLVKYPRTNHLPWSLGATSDDKILSDTSSFEGQRVIVTEKMDGENFTGYRGYTHARSLDSRHNFTRDWVRSFWMARSHEFPENWRLCGENLYAAHSIAYSNLPSYLLGFSVWTDENVCLSWDETVEWFDLLGITSVPVLYDGLWNEKVIKNNGSSMDFNAKEGYVVRLASAFHYNEFGKSVAKFVRANHVQTDEHWLYGSGEVKTNELV